MSRIRIVIVLYRSNTLSPIPTLRVFRTRHGSEMEAKVNVVRMLKDMGVEYADSICTCTSGRFGGRRISFLRTAR